MSWLMKGELSSRIRMEHWFRGMQMTKYFFGETSIGNTGIVSSLGYLENPCEGNDVRTFLAAKKKINSRMKKIVILRHCTFLR